MKKAKRDIPETEPVTIDGVRYDVDFRGEDSGLGQLGGVLSATDEATGELKWRLKVYDVVRNPAKERDTQEVFITSIEPGDEGTILVENESRRRFSVDLATQAVRELAAGR